MACLEFSKITDESVKLEAMQVRVIFLWLYCTDMEIEAPPGLSHSLRVSRQYFRVNFLPLSQHIALCAQALSS